MLRRRVGTLLALAALPRPSRGASLKRPSSTEFSIDFEAADLPCDFAEGDVVRDQYASSMARFSGPGFGGLNGGVRVGGCAVGGGELPPLSNASFDGLGMLGFSTLHTLSDGRTGKPVSPETIRFDVRMTNIRLSLSGLDGHPVTIELCAPPRAVRRAVAPAPPRPRRIRAGTRAPSIRTTTKASCSTRSPSLSPTRSRRSS